MAMNAKQKAWAQGGAIIGGIVYLLCCRKKADCECPTTPDRTQLREEEIAELKAESRGRQGAAGYRGGRRIRRRRSYETAVVRKSRPTPAREQAARGRGGHRRIDCWPPAPIPQGLRAARGCQSVVMLPPFLPPYLVPAPLPPLPGHSGWSIPK